MDFKILTFATNQDNYIFKLLQSKLPLIVLDSKNFDWEGKNTNPAILQFLSQLHEDDLVLLTDSYDVLPLNDCNYETLKNKILSSFDLTKVTFNAETQCFPDKNLAKEYPSAPGKWKYLNGGIMTGTVKNIKNLLNVSSTKSFKINQQGYTDIFLTTNLIDLDYECKCFQTLLAGPYPDFPDIDMNDFIIEGKNVINKYFNTTPLLFHGNGSIKLEPLLPFLKTISD